MKKFHFTSNIILISLIIIFDMLYTFVFQSNILVKSTASSLFLIMGLLNLVIAIQSKSVNLRFSITMVIGLFLSMIGDVAINLKFEIGALLFAIGHVFSFISYCQLHKFQWKDLIYTMFIAPSIIALIIFAPIFNFNSNLLKIVCILYALIISCMLSKALSNFVQFKSRLNLIIMIGGILFCVSDFMLLFDVFTTLPAIMGILCLLTYYPAQIFLAYSILEHTKYQTK